MLISQTAGPIKHIGEPLHTFVRRTVSLQLALARRQRPATYLVSSAVQSQRVWTLEEEERNHQPPANIGPFYHNAQILLTFPRLHCLHLRPYWRKRRLRQAIATKWRPPWPTGPLRPAHKPQRGDHRRFQPHLSDQSILGLHRHQRRCLRCHRSLQGLRAALNSHSTDQKYL